MYTMLLLALACTTADTENPNAIDNDGDGLTELQGDCDDADAAVTNYTYYTDADLDQHGAGAPQVSCAPQPPTGMATTADDCDDGDDATYPGSSAHDTTVCGHDADGDGYVAEAEGGTDCDDGDAGVYPRSSANDPTACGHDDDADGYVAEAEGGADCDDGDAQVHPSTMVPEECGHDHDGDGFVDSADGGSDCDDADVNTYPGAAEAESSTACDTDADDDGWGSRDCDDTNPDVFPGHEEIGGNGVDDDCDATTLGWSEVTALTWDDEMVDGHACTRWHYYDTLSGSGGESEGRVELEGFTGISDYGSYRFVTVRLSMRLPITSPGILTYYYADGRVPEPGVSTWTSMGSSISSDALTTDAWHTIGYEWHEGGATVTLDDYILAAGLPSPFNSVETPTQLEYLGYEVNYGGGDGPWCIGAFRYSVKRL